MIFQNYATTADDKPKTIKKPNVFIKQAVEAPVEVYYKTPFNRGKAFSPTIVGVTKGIKHLKINLLDQDGRDLGVMSLEAADKLSMAKELKLVIIDQSCSPVQFKLMTGPALYELQKEFKEMNKDAVKQLKVKDMEFNLGIEKNDFDIKLKLIRQFYEKGHAVNILVKSKINRKSEKNIPKLQDEFIENMKKEITFAHITVARKNEHNIHLRISAKE